MAKLKNIYYAVGAVCILLASLILMPGPSKEDQVVIIEKGSTSKISQTLFQNGVVRSQLVFFVAAHIMRPISGLYAGEYSFKKSTSIFGVIRKMQSQDIFFRKITIPEGYTTYEVISLINSEPTLKGEVLGEYSEGVLMPQTYYYTYGDDKESILKRMNASMEDTLDRLWQNRDMTIPIKTKEDALTLASIVEKEAKASGDRPKIASVFLNRMKKGMKLEADPTTIYAITQGQMSLGRPLTRKDLLKKSLHNTYYVKGLPPTPIANPGVESLKVVVNPITTEYLYFVVANCSGQHAFAANFREHLQNVAQYKRLRCS